MNARLSEQIFDVLHEISKEKNIPLDVVVENFKDSIFKAAVEVYKYPEAIKIDLNVSKKEFRLMVLKEVVEEVEDPFYEVSLKEAKKYDKKAKVGDQVFVDVDLREFGRNAIYLTKQLINQKNLEAEREGIYKVYKNRIGDIVTGSVQQIGRGEILVSLGKAEAVLPNSEKIRKEHFRPGDIIKAYIYDVKVYKKTPQVFLSRTRPEFLKKLLELEIPEIYNGIVKIMGVARDPGNRAKVAVYSEDEKLDPVGACVGMKGSRILPIVKELANEQIDVVLWDPDLETYIARAIGKNVNVLKISKLTSGKYIVVVPDDELAKAIGKDGQNVKLTSQLVGHTVDVLSESEYNALQKKKLENLYKNEKIEEEYVEEEKQDLPYNLLRALENDEVTIDELKSMTPDEIADKFDLSLDELAQVVEYLKNS